MITKDEIRLIVEQPSKLGPGHDADEYEMEKYQRVAIEQAAAIYGTGKFECPGFMGGIGCPRKAGGFSDCRRCWREWLEAQ